MSDKHNFGVGIGVTVRNQKMTAFALTAVIALTALTVDTAPAFAGKNHEKTAAEHVSTVVYPRVDYIKKKKKVVAKCSFNWRGQIQCTFSTTTN